MEWLFLIIYLAIVALVPLVATAGPVWLFGKMGHPRFGMAFMVILIGGVLIDRYFNWDRIAYPHPALGDFLQSAAVYPYLALAFCYAAFQLVFPPEPFDVDPR